MANVPYPIGHDYGNSFYSFTYGPAYIIVLNSYASVDPGSKQYEWLVKELEGVDRTVTPWLLCMIHCPLYNTFHHHYRDIQLVKGREYLEPLFYSYRVNGVFSGHVHAYQRTRNVYKDKVDRLGPMHVIVGEGGKTINTEARSVQPEEWIAVRDETAYGYGQLILRKCSQFLLQLLYVFQFSYIYNFCFIDFLFLQTIKLQLNGDGFIPKWVNKIIIGSLIRTRQNLLLKPT